MAFVLRKKILLFVPCLVLPSIFLEFLLLGRWFIIVLCHVEIIVFRHATRTEMKVSISFAQLRKEKPFELDQCAAADSKCFKNQSPLRHNDR